MRENKKTSVSLVIFVTAVLSLVAFFLGLVYFRLNPPVNMTNAKEKPVDSATVIQRKDSIINVLNQDNVRLKKMFDEKHDTVWVPKPVYIKPKIDTLN